MKVTAEEKHYKKLNIKLQKELNIVNDDNSKLRRINLNLQNEVNNLNKEVEKLNSGLDYLKSKLNLSDKEIKQLVKSSESINMLGDLASCYGKIFKTM